MSGMGEWRRRGWGAGRPPGPRRGCARALVARQLLAGRRPTLLARGARARCNAARTGFPTNGSKCGSGGGEAGARGGRPGRGAGARAIARQLLARRRPTLLARRACARCSAAAQAPPQMEANARLSWREGARRVRGAWAGVWTARLRSVLALCILALCELAPAVLVLRLPAACCVCPCCVCPHSRCVCLLRVPLLCVSVLCAFVLGLCLCSGRLDRVHFARQRRRHRGAVVSIVRTSLVNIVDITGRSSRSCGLRPSPSSTSRGTCMRAFALTCTELN